MTPQPSRTLSSAADLPIPSITLQITKKDADRFLKASQALMETFRHLYPDQTLDSGNDGNSFDSTRLPSSERTDIPLHERTYKAAQQCQHPVVSAFLEHARSNLIPIQEIQASTLLFHDSDKTFKLRHYFSALSSESDGSGEAQLTRQETVALFRCILISISSCVHTPDCGDAVIVEGKAESDAQEAKEPQRKRMKRTEDTDSKRPFSNETVLDFRTACQSPSFDSSMATLRDEDDKETESLRREIEEIATYAADELFKHMAAKEGESSSRTIHLATFGDWYNSKGNSIVPWLELVQVTKWQAPPSSKKVPPPVETNQESPASLMNEDDSSRVLVSFDFSGSGSPVPLLVNITEDNLVTLRRLVHRTGLINRPPSEICKNLLQMATRRTVGSEVLLTLHGGNLERVIVDVVSARIMDALPGNERKTFLEFFSDFFECFEEGNPNLHYDEVDMKAFAMGFCLFCSGNKSTKLSTGFELLDEKKNGYLTEAKLQKYLEAYLTMLVGLSFLTPSSKRHNRRPMTKDRRKAMKEAVHNGASWTMGHYLKSIDGHGGLRGEHTFESFANWYSLGGYNVAPWLELLDLSKLFSLISEPESPILLPPLQHHKVNNHPPQPRDRVSTLRRHHSSRRGFPPEALFTFPLANRRSLMVLKEDATYVKGVVEHLGLLSVKPDELWSSLQKSVASRRVPVRSDEPIYVDMPTFVGCMQDICPKLSRKRSAAGKSSYSSASVEEILSNFFQCFDIDQVNRVALDELMGGLTLLCGGKKSTKLAFAFSVFDTRPGIHERKLNENISHSLSGEDLFLFLRSILIVTFSCCRQSLDMTDDMVGRCIADTANMICNDVMRHQWEAKRLDRLDFDEFGQWYNDGGFERAPWLELLDLRKWVLVDNFETLEKQVAPPPGVNRPPLRSRATAPINDPTIPPPPPEDALDSSFFDENAIMPMDSMDEMDMILMQHSTDKDADEGSGKILKTFSFSPRNRNDGPRRNPLKFHLVTDDPHGGFMMSLSHFRIRNLRTLIEASTLHSLDCETVCNKLIRHGNRLRLSEPEFLSSIRSICSTRLSLTTAKAFDDLLVSIFNSFELDRSGKASALELACGMTVLCRGKKSDKLEFAFEVLDKNKKGKLSKADMTCYLRGFLTVLLGVAFSKALEFDSSDDTVFTMKGDACERSHKTLDLAVKAGADWATSLAFRDFQHPQRDGVPAMSFDDFAEWYTSVGYSSIPWLELLDLHKWVFNVEST